MAGRGDLPFALLHGKPLVSHALRAARRAADGDLAVVVDDHCRAAMVALVRSDDPVLDVDGWWGGRGARAEVVHDPLCPLVPSDFLRDLARRSRDGVARAAYRPVTDTVKTARDGTISGTVDRDRLGAVVSPVTIPAGVGAGEPPAPLDLAGLVGWLRERGPVALERAPSLAGRVDDVGGVTLLECVDETARRVTR